MTTHLKTYNDYSDDYVFEHLLLEGKAEEVHKKYYSDIPQHMFYQLIELDPTNKKKGDDYSRIGVYFKWILKLYQNKELSHEQILALPELLKFFHDNKQHLDKQGEEIDIFKHNYASLLELFNVYQNTYKPKKKLEDESELIKNRYHIEQGNADIYYEDDEFLIVSPNTIDASQFYSYDSDWCTVYPRSFKFYNEIGPLYLILDKTKLNTNDPNRRLLVQFSGMDQFTNLEHHSILPYILKHPTLSKIFNNKFLKENPPSDLLQQEIDQELKNISNES